MTTVGVIGLGMMGGTHLDAYAKLSNVKVVAVSDMDPKRLAGEQTVEGNVEGQAQSGFDLKNPSLKRYADGLELIADPDIDLVDICVPTPWHANIAIAALEAGKHVLLEKPLVRRSDEIDALLEAEKQAKGIIMCAMCMRFWPAWEWLKQAVDNKTYGKVLSATFRRVASHPSGRFYQNGDQCGGAALDLHIHDTDFIQHLFGMPSKVSSVGYSKPTTAVDHLSTRYFYDDIPMVIAEGGWTMTEGFGFKMQYTVNFEKATAVFDIGEEKQLMLHTEGADSQEVQVDAAMGYEREIAYLLDCIEKGVKPSRVTLEDAARAIRIVEAEVQSVQTGEAVSL